jgi:plasmid replication initiation protein
MAKPAPADSNRPLMPGVLDIRRFDESNVARLGIISIQERIPPDYTSWTVELELEGHRARLTCEAPEKYGGVPHGLDNDVSLALITLYQDAGSPEDGSFMTTAYQILKVIGLDTSGYYYETLKESLERLFYATYTASESWREGGKWVTAKFRFLNSLDYISDNDRLGLSSSSVLKIGLAEQIVRSIRSKYLKPLDLEFLTSLQRPLTRALYRLLDAQRFSEAGNLNSLEVNIIQWAEACKIVDHTPFKVRRTLEGAHDELMVRGYLRGVHYEGRGVAQTIRYTFAERQQNPALDPEGLQLLTRYGVVSTVARALVRLYPPERVRERVEKYLAILQAGYTPRNRAGFLVDVLKDEAGKYADPEGFVSLSRKEQTTRAKSKLVQIQMQQELFAEEQHEREWLEMTAEQKVQRSMRSLMMVLGKRLSPLAYDGLQEAMKRGDLEPRKVVELALRANLEGKLTELASQWMDNFGGG